MSMETDSSEERHWQEIVYRGDKMPELSSRAIVSGIFLGILVMSENVYMGLKIGITEAGSILSAILCFALFKSFKKSISVLENNTAQTLSSAAGSIGIIVSVVPALHLIGYELSGPQILLWVLLVAFLGLLFAIPLRRQLIVNEKLTFPTGLACAETITAMHAQGDAPLNKAKALGITGLLSGAITWFRDAVPILIPTTSTLPLNVGGYSLEKLSLGVYWSPLVIGVGLMIGFRIGLSLLMGALLCWGVLGPALAGSHIIANVSHPDITHWTMWPAISLMVFSGFTSLFLKRGMIARSIRSMTEASYTRNSLEFPFRWWAWGLLVISLSVVLTMQLLLQVPAWLGVITVILSFVFATVAVRGYGETDISPVGTMGHANQIVSGIILPGQSVTNLAAGGISAGCSDVASDLMQVLKTGYILGATPRRQIFSQFIGVTLGSVIAVLVYLTLTSAHQIGSESLPAPGALPWSGMATLLAEGSSALPPWGLGAVAIGGCAGILLTILEKSRYGRFVPSPFGLGIGLVVPGFISVSVFLGSIAGIFLQKRFTKFSQEYLIPVASGGIAGEAVISVLISLLSVAGIIPGQ